MNKTLLRVPKGIRKLSEWSGFFNYIPTGKVILNKKITGCGATTLFLKHNRPLIFVAHRSELLSCKAESDLHKGEVCLFKDPSDKGVDVLSNNMTKLNEYLDKCCGVDPFSSQQVMATPKVLVTADSLHHVIDLLKARGELERFCAVSDEMQCIFTDAAFKGDTVLNYLQCLGEIKDVILLSATPFLEAYLDQIDEFKDLPYVELDWESLEPGRVIKPNIRTKKVISLSGELDAIIAKYKTCGFFEERMCNGEIHRSKQGVFYLNSVEEIISAINRNHLNQDECNIICSKTNNKNLSRLHKIGFSVGSAQKEGEIHKVYTFITKCSFEGVDLYHPSGFTYIFANPNKKNLALDISIDLDQIMGRQRLESNVFGRCAKLFFKITQEENLKDCRQFAEHIKTKMELTRAEIQSFSSLSKNARSYKIGQITSAHQNLGFQFDYLSFVQDQTTKEWTPKENFLVRMSEIRAWDIRNNIYLNEVTVLCCVNNLCSFNQTIQDFLFAFESTGDFILRMRSYCEFLANNPSLQDELEYRSIGVIDVEYHQFYRALGPDIIKANKYQRSLLLKQMDCYNYVDRIEEAIKGEFCTGVVISRVEAKRKLQVIYDTLRIQKTAKATDLEAYFDIRRTRPNGEDCIILSEKGCKV